MTLGKIKEQIMYQTNNDADDLPDFEPHIADYVNEGYNILVYAYHEKHVGHAEGEIKPLSDVSDEPQLPEYAHRALADYGTYMVYRNGNMVKQNRGMAFYSMFMDIVARLKFERGGVTKRQFINIYTR